MKPTKTVSPTARRTILCGILFFLLTAAAALVLGMPAAAQAFDEEEIPFDEAVIYFELNHTDGDLGIHAMVDGEPWKRLEIEGPDGRKLLDVSVRGRLRRQGLTEIFFESAEPSFDELDPEEFFARFPKGTYEIEGLTLEGEELESEVALSHVLPAPPVIYVNGNPAAEDCDADELPQITPGDPVTLSWDPVDGSHPEVGETGDMEVRYYEVVVEIDDTPWKTSAVLTAETTSFEVPPEILAMAEDAVKFEVLVRAANNNQTGVESCFVIVETD